MALGYLDDSKLTAIANSIRSKAGTSGTMTVDQMPTNISAIPTPIVEKDVNFYDWDGTLLYSYHLAEARALQALPALPADYKDYTADSWTETLSFINNLTYPWQVGVKYTTTRANAKFYITVPEPDTDLGEDTSVYIYTRSSGYTVDWGDGTSSTTASYGRIQHTYATAGDYVLTYNGPLESTNSEPFMMSSRQYLLFQSGSSSGGAIYNPDNLVTLVECGNSTRIGTYSFFGQMSLNNIIMPYGTTITTYSPFARSGIKTLTLPMTTSPYIYQLFAYMPNLEQAIAPSIWFTTANTYMYKETYNYSSKVRKINWPEVLLRPVSADSSEWQNCFGQSGRCLERKLVIPNNVTLISPGFWNMYSFGSGDASQALIQDVELGPIPSSVTNIQSDAFCGWLGKTDTLEFTQDLSYIGTRAFRQSSFKTFIFHQTEPPEIDNQTFGRTNDDSKYLRIYVPYGTKQAYVAASSYWSGYANYIFELPQS